MAAPSFFTKSLLRIAKLQGRSALESLVTGQFTTLSAQGGKQITTASENGKSFSFQVDSGMGVSQLMSYAEEALEYWDGSTPEQVETLLGSKPVHVTRGTFA